MSARGSWSWKSVRQLKKTTISKSQLPLRSVPRPNEPPCGGRTAQT
jgi:hypothetical protein